MNDEIRDRIHGGFNGALRAQMSPQLQRQLAEQEAVEAREAKELERERSLRAEAYREGNIQAAIAQALESGQEFSPRMLRGESLGRTVSEALACYSAMADAEDARLAARARVAFNRWQQQHAELNSGDFTAPTPEEMASRAESEARHREASIQGSVRRYERKQILKEARKNALHDSLTIAAASRRY